MGSNPDFTKNLLMGSQTSRMMLKDVNKCKLNVPAEPPGQPIGVNVHCTQHPIREQSLSSQPSQKTQKLSTQIKNHSHASRIPSPDQSPSCHSAEWKTPLLPCPAS
ncbi:hypothetical protein TNCV_4142471 [Trichonephila clavipes]|nr:hypothetical protein TNCV_4142471 [Trichonephila clavipes]